MKTGIYKITNLLNGKIYIGKAIDLSVRLQTHRKYDTPEKYNGSLSFENEKRMPIHQAIMKYHLKNFKIEIIEECLPSELNEKEQYYIKYFNCKVPNGYNLTDGEDGGCSPKGEDNHFNKYTKKSIDRIKQLLKQNIPPLEIYKKYNIDNISLANIYSINIGKTWKDPQEEYPLCSKKMNKKFTIQEADIIKIEFQKIAKEKGKMKSYEFLAKKYNCSSRTISRIINGA